MALITKKFFSNIKDKKHKSKILSRLSKFECVLKENNEVIREIPSSFWIKKIIDTDVFKFRLNSGDRILYTYIDSRDKENEKDILFLSYCDHDSQIRIGKNINIKKKKNISESLEINYDTYEKETNLDEKINKDYKTYDYDLETAYIYVVDEKTIGSMVNNKNSDYLYYLSNDQLSCLKKIDKPLVLTGAAGSGKSTIALYKLLALKNKKVLYITYTELLCDKMKTLYSKFGNNSKDLIEFTTIKEFYENKLKVKENKIVSYEKFKIWIDSKRNLLRYKVLKNYDLLNIWTEIQGIIKGYIGVNNEFINSYANKDRFELSIEEYLSMPVKYSLFSDDDKKEIYSLYEEYKKWCNTNKYNDDNDLAYLYMNSIKKEFYDFIVVDEVQDLSELQIAMISNLIEDKSNIMYCGDAHQIVNPTFFKFGRLKNIYYSNGMEVELKTLTKNYRNTIEIIELLNKLTKKRQEIVGKTSYDYLESGIRHGEVPKLLDVNNKEIFKILESVKERHYCAIVVPNEEEKYKLEKINPEAGRRVFTVSEIKGLEYENIYCINFISSNEKIWKEISKSRKNEVYRYYFNLLYVALSRGLDNIFLYESNMELINELELFNVDIEVIKDINIKSLKIEGVSTKQEWKVEAEKLKKVALNRKSKFATDKSKEKIVKELNKYMDERCNKNLEDVKFEEVRMDYCGDSEFMKLGFLNFQKRNYNAAIKLYEKALELEPENYKIYYHMANAYGYMRGGMELSLPYFDKAIELNTKSYLVYIDKASILVNLNKQDEAIEAYLKATEIEPDAITAWASLAIQYYTKYTKTGKRKNLVAAREFNDKALKGTYNYDYDSHNKIWNKMSENKIKKMKFTFEMQKNQINIELGNNSERTIIKKNSDNLEKIFLEKLLATLNGNLGVGDEEFEIAEEKSVCKKIVEDMISYFNINMASMITRERLNLPKEMLVQKMEELKVLLPYREAKFNEFIKNKNFPERSVYMKEMRDFEEKVVFENLKTINYAIIHYSGNIKKDFIYHYVKYVQIYANIMRVLVEDENLKVQIYTQDSEEFLSEFYSKMEELAEKVIKNI